jgi:hypothetical protein
MTSALTRRAAALLLAVLATLVLVALSRVPYAAERRGDALLRLSWRMAGEYIEECRVPSEEELARLPLHMRRERICDGRLLPYRLVLRIDDRVVLDEWVRGAGARQDRPLAVFHELRLEPGERHVSVSWTPERGTPRVPGERSAAEAAAEAASARHELAAQLRFEASDVALITYDIDARRLVARGRGVVAFTSRSPADPTRPRDEGDAAQDDGVER